MATVMNNANPNTHPHRKPVPGQMAAQRNFNNMPPPQQMPQARQPSPSQYPHQNYPPPRPRDSSNSPPIYGVQPQPQPQQQPPPQRFAQQHPQPNGHYPSASTSSTYTTMTNPSNLSRAPTNASTLPRRSASSRSNGSSGSPTSYVALMRKQKATVWCDRAQHEDPNILAKQRAARIRAAMEVAGGKHHGNRVSTSSSVPGIRSKIRHQGAPKAGRYAGGANMSGAGVPIRLSATEVDDDDSEEEKGHPGGSAAAAAAAQRTGSGRSSLASAPRTSSNLNVSGGPGRSNESTPPSGVSPVGGSTLLDSERTPVPNATNANQSDYFQEADEEVFEEEKFGGVGGLPPSKPPKTEKEMKMEEELRRRGSVDDRAMTMSGQRLFVANPDLSD